MGYALGLAQLGGKHPHAKPWKGEGPAIFEVVENFEEHDVSNNTEFPIAHGTTNVFADLGLPDPVERQTKTRLARQVNELLKQRRLKQVEAGWVLNIPQSKVSALVNYRLDGFSVEKLMEFLTLLDQDVEILIRPSRQARSPGHVTVHAVR